MLRTSEFLWPQISRSVTSDPFEVYVVLRTIFFSSFIDNFHNAVFQEKLARNDGLDSVCQNSSLLFAQIFNEFDSSPFSISENQ